MTPRIGRWRHVLVALAAAWLLGAGAVASGQMLAISTEHVTVLYDDPALEEMARRSALLAEEAVEIVGSWFDSEPFPVTLHIDASTDVFNALAAPIPRPTVALRFVPPVESGVGLGAEDWLELLLVHELAHLGHFTRTSEPALGVGLVGENVAPPPPLWVVEGLATWLESELSDGGRRDDAFTAGLLATLAAGDAWPTLDEASTGTVGGWPGGRTRYLLGSVFLDVLVKEHGWQTVLAAIESFNAAPLWTTFESVWHQETGQRLDEAWRAWRDDVARDAEARASALPPPSERLTESGGTTGLPTLSPGGERMAWRTGAHAIAVAPLHVDDNGRMTLGEPTTFTPATAVASLDWLDERTLVYSRIAPTASTQFADVFALDAQTGREVRWTEADAFRSKRRWPGLRIVGQDRAGPTRRRGRAVRHRWDDRRPLGSTGRVGDRRL